MNGAETARAAPESERALDSLRAELRRIDRELESGQALERDVSREMDMIARRVALLGELVRDQREQIARLQDSIAAIETEIGPREAELARLGSRMIEIEDHQQQLSSALARSLLAEHRMAGAAAFDFLLGAGSWRELLARRGTLMRLQRTASRSLHRLAAAADTLQEAEDAVFVSTRELRERKARLEASRRQAGDLRRDLQRDIVALESDKRGLQSRLKRLRSDRHKLEDHRREVAAAQAQIEEMIGKIARGEPMSGMPLSMLKGSLPWPVSGRVVVRFGTVRNRELATITENPGIEIASYADATVSAVAEGRVSSVTWLRGYGNVCIVEHPGAFYTVYARLGQVVVQPNTPVQSGTVLGYPGFDAGSEDYRVHFELWSGREKKNPLEWLRPR